MRAGGVVAALVLVRAAPKAHAADVLTLLDWACDPDDANTKAVRTDLLASCELTAGAATVCAAVSGTPTACQRLNAGAAKTDTCGGNTLDVTITGDTGSTLGWTVSGTLTVSAAFSYSMTSTPCIATPISPPPDGTAGTYVDRAGTATATATFIASGTGSISFLGGTIFSVSHQQTCTRSLTADGHTNASTAACRRRCTTTTTGTRTGEQAMPFATTAAPCLEDAVIDERAATTIDDAAAL